MCRVGKDEIFGEESTSTSNPPTTIQDSTSPVVKDPSEDKKLGTPHIMITPAAEGEAAPKPRRPANLVTSWGPNVMKLKEKSKQASGQGPSVVKTRSSPRTTPQGPAPGVKTRSSPRNAPQLPPKSSNAIKQQQSGKINYQLINQAINY